jgi:hypothetical protein
MKRRISGRQALLLGGVLLVCLIACGPDKKKPAASPPNPTGSTLQATVQRRLTLENIPSASGMELIGNRVYVVGDDSPFLFVLDLATLKQVEQIRLFGSGNFGLSRIPKLLKPDLECLTQLDIKGVNNLVAFGSGSSPNRNQVYTIALPAGNQKATQVEQHSLEDLYKALQANKDLLGDEVLNLEAAATTSDKVLLLQRATEGGANLILSFPRQDFVAYLTGSRKNLPGYEAIAFHLPKLAGLSSRFSGAFVYHNRLFFSASVENTDDAILDGEVLGSFVGWIDLAVVKPGGRPVEGNTALVLDEKGETFKGKVESLVIVDSLRTQGFRALAITDNDNGQSELLELDLSWPGGPAD